MEEQYFSIDRFEENFVVCENRRTKEKINIRREDLPEKIDEGTILKLVDGKYIPDIEKTEEVRKNMLEKMNKLFNN